MAALMAAAPVAMQLDGHSYERSTYAIEVHIVGMYLPAMFVGDFMAGLRCLVTLSPVWLTPLLLLLPPMHPWPVFVREPHLRLAVQGGMDTLVVTMSAVANATAGTLVKAMSWQHFVELNMATNAVLALANLGYHLHLGRRHGLQGSGCRR
ncbi:MFS transporter, partial [Haematococcus lacustris]